MTDEPIVEPATPSAKLAARDTFRILIMDTIEHTDQLKEACKDVGHSVVASQTIKEAFAFLDGKDHADVIVCAAYLEDESMFDFLRRLRLDPIHEKTMFMTLALAPGPVGAKVNSTAEKTGRLLGADAFLNMPVFDAAQLIAEIKKLLPAVPALEISRLAEVEAKRELVSEVMQITGPKYRLTLYVTPDNSGKALACLYKALEILAYNDYQLNIIDIIKHPEVASEAGIIGSPTLVYHAVDGDKMIKTVSDIRTVRDSLGL